MARHTVPLNEALQALRNEVVRGVDKTASVAPVTPVTELPELLRKTAELIRASGDEQVTYNDLYRVKEAFYARR